MLLSARLRYCCQAKVVYPYIPAKHDDFIMSTSLLTNVPAERRRSQVMRRRSQNHRKNFWSEPAIFLGIFAVRSLDLHLLLSCRSSWFPLSSSLFFLLNIYAPVIFDIPDSLQQVFVEPWNNPQYISAPIILFYRSVALQIFCDASKIYCVFQLISWCDGFLSWLSSIKNKNWDVGSS